MNKSQATWLSVKHLQSVFASVFGFLSLLLPNTQQTKIFVTKSSIYKAETVYEGRLKVIILLQVSSHDFEPTFIILVLICRILPDQPKYKQITKPLIHNQHLSLLYFCCCLARVLDKCKSSKPRITSNISVKNGLELQLSATTMGNRLFMGCQPGLGIFAVRLGLELFLLA